MTEHRYAHLGIPDAAERTRLNAAMITEHTETGWYDDTGRPAPWPDDFNDWRPATSNNPTPPDRQPPF